jgi:flagellar basal body L-ring protein FlgH
MCSTRVADCARRTPQAAGTQRRADKELSVRILQIILATSVVLLVPQLASGQSKGPTEAQCREMTNSMVSSMKSAPLEKEKDKQSAKAIIDRTEKLIRDHRARGVGDCETWASISKMVTNQ